MFWKFSFLSRCHTAFLVWWTPLQANRIWPLEKDSLYWQECCIVEYPRVSIGGPNHTVLNNLPTFLLKKWKMHLVVCYIVFVYAHWSCWLFLCMHIEVISYSLLLRSFLFPIPKKEKTLFRWMDQIVSYCIYQYSGWEKENKISFLYFHEFYQLSILSLYFFFACKRFFLGLFYVNSLFTCIGSVLIN